jgi:spermidine synthase
LLELPSPSPLQPGWLRLLEPLDSSHAELLQQLTDGTYTKPFIEDCGPLRYLHFDLDNVQSVMRLDEPDALCLAYTRKMMAFLLFNSEPRRILQLGLGGGSLAKFCYRHLPDASITVLEIDSDVLALREEFRVPPNDQRFRVVQGDGVQYIAGRAPREDIILVDACDRTGLSPTLSAPDLYSNLRRHLNVDGVSARWSMGCGGCERRGACGCYSRWRPGAAGLDSTTRQELPPAGCEPNVTYPANGETHASNPFTGRSRQTANSIPRK